MRHQVGGKHVQPALGHRQCLQPGQPADGPVLLGFVLVVGDLQKLVHQGLLLGLVEAQLDDARLVADRHHRVIVLCGDHVVHVHIGAKHRLGVAVVQAHRRAGHAQVDRVRQRIAHVLGQTVAGLAGLGIQIGLEAVLRAVRFVGNHDDVGTLAQHRHRSLASLRGELVDGGEDDAAGLHLRKLVTQVVATVRLLRRAAQRPRAVGKRLVQLAVQIVAVGHQHHGRVAKLRVVAQRHHIEQRQQRLARALGKPDHATLAVLLVQQRIHRTRHRLAHAVVLVPLRDDLETRATIGTTERDETAQERQQRARLEQPQHQHVQFQPPLGHLLAAQQAPARIASELRRQRAVARHRAVGNDVQQVAVEQLRDVRLVGLDLVPRRLDVGVQIGRILQLDHHQRQAVDEQYDVRPAHLQPVHGELLHRQQVVGTGEVDYPHAQHVAPAIGFDALHRHAIAQPVVDLLVAVHQRLRAVAGQLVHRFVDFRRHQRRIQPQQRFAQARCQHRIRVAIASTLRAAGRHVVTVQTGPAQFTQPVQAGGFEVVFLHCFPCNSYSR